MICKSGKLKNDLSGCITASGYVDKEITNYAAEDDIDELRHNFFDLTPEEIGKWMTEDDWQIHSTNEKTMQIKPPRQIWE
jgi:hypothetical protein